MHAMGFYHGIWRKGESTNITFVTNAEPCKGRREREGIKSKRKDLYCSLDHQKIQVTKAAKIAEET